MTSRDWPVPLEDNHYQLSYAIRQRAGAAQLSVNDLKEALRVANQNVRNVVWTGWSMFYQFTRKEIAPRIVVDKSAGTEVEAFETNLRGETLLDTTLPDYWRVTVDGRATLIRAYREDRSEIPPLVRKGAGAGKWLSPRTLIRELYELATHAKELAKAFEGAENVEFYCSWCGLKGRIIGDFDPGIDWNERTCHVNERSVGATVTLDRLTGDTAGVVAELAAPVLRLFDGLELGREWITKEVPKFREL